MFDYLTDSSNYIAPELSKNGMFDVVFRWRVGNGEKCILFINWMPLKNNSFHLKIMTVWFLSKEVIDCRKVHHQF